jgi:hypothetical protein
LATCKRQNNKIRKEKKRGVRSSKLPIPYKQHRKGNENKFPCEQHKNKIKWSLELITCYDNLSRASKPNDKENLRKKVMTTSKGKKEEARRQEARMCKWVARLGE